MVMVRLVGDVGISSISESIPPILLIFVEKTNLQIFIYFLADSVKASLV